MIGGLVFAFIICWRMVLMLIVNGGVLVTGGSVWLSGIVDGDVVFVGAV